MNCKDSFLYDLATYNEWTVEHLEKRPREYWVSAYSFLRGMLTTSTGLIHPRIVTARNAELPWKLAVSSSGNHLVILQTSTISLYSINDNFSECEREENIKVDSDPKYRLIEWSPNDDFVIYCSSDGRVIIYNACLSIQSTFELGDRLSASNVLENIPCALCSKQSNANAINIFILTFRGKLFCYTFSTSHLTVTCDTVYPIYLNTGVKYVSQLAVVPLHGLLLLGAEANDSVSDSDSRGIIRLRFINESPFLKRVGTESGHAKSRLWFWHNPTVNDGILKLRVFKTETLLLALHWSGDITVWSLPGLILLCNYPVREQQLFQSETDIRLYFRHNRSHSTDCDRNLQHLPSDVQWWSDNKFLISRYSGVVTLHDAETDFTNLMGSCELFEATPQIKQSCELPNSHTAAFVLEHDTTKHSKSLKSVLISDDEEDYEDMPLTVRIKKGQYLKRAMYFLTESERFQPPQKKPKLYPTTYRLYSFCSTTPENFFKAKLKNEEFGEALLLAQRYNLDTDIVYMKQWRKYEVSGATILDYLGKIEKKFWVIKECIERVPKQLDACKKLVEYGLEITDIEAVIKLTDKNWQHCECGFQSDGENVDPFLSRDERNRIIETARQTHIQNCLFYLIDWKNLTIEQKDYLSARRKLLYYWKFLNVYEEILGGYDCACELFDHKVYTIIRNQSILENCMDFAHSNDSNAVFIMISNYFCQLYKYYLMLLSNFIETYEPKDYCEILPELDQDDKIICPFDKIEESIDWCLSENALEYFQQSDFYGNFIVSSYHGSEYISDEFSSQIVSEWYSKRALEFEHFGGNILNAIQILDLGIDRNVSGLLQLKSELEVFRQVIYDCQSSLLIKFSEFLQWDDLERLKMLISNVDPDGIANDFRLFVIPYVSKFDKTKSRLLITEILISLSKESLSLVSGVFANSKRKLTERLIEDVDFLLELAVNCVYACERVDQLHICYSILDALPLRSSIQADAGFLDTYFSKVETMEYHMEAAHIFEKYDVHKPLSFFLQSSLDFQKAKTAMEIIFINSLKRKPSISSDDWITIFCTDVLYLQRYVFSVVPMETIVELFVSMILSFGTAEIVHLATKFMRLSPEGSEFLSFPKLSSVKRLSFDLSCDIILKAANEFIDGSISFTDSSLRKAKNFCALIGNPPLKIKKVLDLLESFAIINQFDVDLLPAQVRQMPDKTDVIKTIISQDVKAYKQYKLMFRLHNILSGSPKDSRKYDPNAAILIGNASFLDGDVMLSSKMAVRLVEMKVPESWELCYTVAKSTKINDLNLRKTLLVFSIAHCPEHILLEALTLLKDLDKSIISEKLSATETTESTDMSFPSLNLNNRENFMESDVERCSLYEAFFRRDSDMEHFEVDFNNFNKFWHYDKPFSSKEFEPGFYQYILRKLSIEDFEESYDILCNLILSLCQVYHKTDKLLASYYLACLKEEDVVCELLKRIENSESSLTYILHTLSVIIFLKQNYNINPYDIKPSLLIAFVNENAPTSAFTKVFTLLEEFVQNKKLKAFDSSIDLDTFLKNSEYRIQTLQGLCMSDEPGIYDMCINLAKKHEIPCWEISKTHLEFILTNSVMEMCSIEKYINERNDIIMELISKPIEFGNFLLKSIFPLLPGANLKKLHIFYTILLNVSQYIDIIPSPEEHCEILSILILHKINVDYKILTHGELDAYDVLQSQITTSNIGDMCKIIVLIPNSITGIAISESLLYKKFIENELTNFSLLCSKDDVDWFDLLQFCQASLSKLVQVDIQSFVENFCFSVSFVSVSPLSVRKALLKKAMSVYKSLRINKEKSSKTKAKFTDFEIQIQSQLKHLELLERSAAFQKWLESDKLHELAVNLELANGNFEKFICKGFFKYIANGVEIKEIDLILESFFKQSSSTVLDVIVSIVDEIFNDNNIKSYGYSDFSKSPLNILLFAIEKHFEDWGEAITETDLLNILRKYFTNDEFPLDYRIALLERVTTTFNAAEEDANALLRLRSQSLIRKIDESLINLPFSNEAERLQTSSQLLDNLTVDNCLTFLKLLNIWPLFNLKKPQNHPYFRLFCLWSSSEELNEDEILQIVTKSAERFKQEIKLHFYVVFSVVKILAAKGFWGVAAMIAFRSGLTGCNEFTWKSVDCDNAALAKFFSDVCNCFINSNSFSSAVDTSFFEPLCSYAASKCGDVTISELVEELRSSGFRQEANELEYKAKGSMGLAGISSAFSYVHKMFSN